MTVTSDSACNSPADSSVWSPSISNPSTRTFTCRIWRSVRSSQCFFSRSIAFKSLMVVVCMTSTMRSPPSKVFTFSSRRMTSMAARESSTRYGRRLRCVSNMWGALKSTASLLRCTIEQLGLYRDPYNGCYITGSRSSSHTTNNWRALGYCSSDQKKWRFPNFEP